MKAAGRLFLCVVVTMSAASLAGAAPVPDSQRLAKAKDYIADEQWNKAVEELRKAADDPKEPNRDEAMFWLAHSQHQAGDQAGAIETIARLERTFPGSRWVHPARSLRVEIAQLLNRDDLLWHFAVPPPPAPATPAPATPAPATPAPRAAPAPATPPAPASPTPGPPMRVPAPRPAVAPVPSLPPMPPGWLPEAYVPDTDVRIQALGGLIQTHPDRVIPLLREIALDPANTAEGRRAVFVLAQSRNAQAEGTVFELARRAAQPVRIAAIREMGRFESTKVPVELLQIARTEADPRIRDTAIVTLGRAGARDQLRELYAQMASLSARATVLTALCSTRDEDELIRIATTDKSPELRAQARRQLQLLGTPKAQKFLSEK